MQLAVDRMRAEAGQDGRISKFSNTLMLDSAPLEVSAHAATVQAMPAASTPPRQLELPTPPVAPGARTEPAVATPAATEDSGWSVGSGSNAARADDARASEARAKEDRAAGGYPIVTAGPAAWSGSAPVSADDSQGVPIDASESQVVSEGIDDWAAPASAWGKVKNAVDFHAVAYVFSSAADALRKRKEMTALSEQISAEEEQFGPVLLALGRQARAADLATPPVAQEMAAVKQHENERRQAEERIAELEQQRATEERQFALADEALSQKLAAAEQVVAQLNDALDAQVRERSGYNAAIGRIDAQLRSLSKQISSLEAAILREKDAGEIAKLQGESQAVRVQVSALEPERERFALKSSALDAPIADLEIRLAAARDEVDKLRGERDGGRSAHSQREAELANEIANGRTRSSELEREISLKLANVGTLLNLNRVAGPAFDPLYAQFDAIKERVTSCEHEITSLQTAVQAYDRDRIQKGIYVLAGSVGVLVLLVVLGVWVF